MKTYSSPLLLSLILIALFLGTLPGQAAHVQTSGHALSPQSGEKLQGSTHPENTAPKLKGEPMVQIAVGIVVLIFGILALFPVLVETGRDHHSAG
jgi:hypothetical protein